MDFILTLVINNGLRIFKGCDRYIGLMNSQSPRALRRSTIRLLDKMITRSTSIWVLLCIVACHLYNVENLDCSRLNGCYRLSDQADAGERKSSRLWPIQAQTQVAQLPIKTNLDMRIIRSNKYPSVMIKKFSFYSSPLI